VRGADSCIRIYRNRRARRSTKDGAAQRSDPACNAVVYLATDVIRRWLAATLRSDRHRRIEEASTRGEAACGDLVSRGLGYRVIVSGSLSAFPLALVGPRSSRHPGQSSREAYEPEDI